MADGQRVEPDPDFFDDEAHDLLSYADIERVRARAERGPELSQRFAQAQIARLVDGRELERLAFRREDVLLGPERRHPVAQLVERGQLVLVRGDQPLDAVRQPRQLTGELLDTLATGIRVPGGVEPAIQFGLDQGRILEEAQDLAPHERIELILPHGTIRTDRPRPLAIPLAPPAAVVPPPPIQRVATLLAHQQALQERRRLRPPPREVGVGVQALLRQGEGHLADERRHGNFQPLGAGAIVIRRGPVGPRPPSRRRRICCRGPTPVLPKQVRP